MNAQLLMRFDNLTNLMPDGFFLFLFRARPTFSRKVYDKFLPHLAYNWPIFITGYFYYLIYKVAYAKLSLKEKI